MSIKDVFGKVFGFLRSAGPAILQFKDAIDFIVGVLKVRMNSGDVRSVQRISAVLRKLFLALIDFAHEGIDVCDKLDQAVDPAGDGGSDLTGAEIKGLLAELDDLGPAALEFPKLVAEAVSEVQSIVK